MSALLFTTSAAIGPVCWLFRCFNVTRKLKKCNHFFVELVVFNDLVCRKHCWCLRFLTGWVILCVFAYLVFELLFPTTSSTHLSHTPDAIDKCRCCGNDSGCSGHLGLGDGDCDSDDQCAGDLVCGQNNSGAPFRSTNRWSSESPKTWDTTDDCCELRCKGGYTINAGKTACIRMLWT